VTGFAEQLRSLRETRSLTQEELAERAGLTVKAVGALERGERRRPYPHTVRSLADALQLDEAERAALVAAVPSRGGAEPVRPEPPRPTSLPSPTGPVVGRDGETAVLVALLGEPPRPVLTLTGPGGVGKTTVALAAARLAADRFPGGVHVVDLATARRPVDVVRSVAVALGVPEAGLDGSAAALAPYLTGRRVLLVLDNLEQVLDAGPELAGLVGLCPDLVVLGTSRAALRIRAEHEVPVQPLDQETSVRLFRDRAEAAGGRLTGSPDEDAAVAELCRRVDGLPLAVELAASATSVLEPAALLTRMDEALSRGPRDLPERQRSISATLDWSHGLLEPDEQALLARLSVFPEGFSLAAAEAVGGPGTLPALRALLDHSLVARAADVQGTRRFRLLVPVQEYAAGRLEAQGRTAALDGLTGHVLDTARHLEPSLRSVDLPAALDLAEADLASVRVARGHLVEAGRLDDAAELVWALWLSLALRGHAREAASWADLSGRPVTDLARARSLVAQAGLAYVVGDIDAVRRRGESALPLARAAGDADLVTEAAVLAGSGALFGGDLRAAAALLDEAAASGSAEPWRAAHRLVAEGQVALLAGRLEDAERLLVDAEEHARALGNPFTLATALNVRATLTELQDAHAASARLLVEALELSVAASISWTMAYTLPALAGVAVRLGEPATGARLFAASASYSAEHAVATNFQPTRELADRDLAHARGQLGEDAFRTAWDSGRELTGPGVVALARGLSAPAPG
jgi:predicted ATPase/DNA-binding XRE family transcriptional regulator